MSTTHPEVTTTEWEDLQIKHGNYAERPKVVREAAVTDALIDLAEQQDPLEKKSLEQLRALEDDVSEDELRAYRQRRLAEMREKAAKYRFGSLVMVTSEDYVEQVTEASKNSCVVFLLYTEDSELSLLLKQQLARIAEKFGDVKFAAGIAANVVPNFPRRLVPTVMIYNKGSVEQISGSSIWGGESMNEDTVEWVLASHKVLRTTLEEDPRNLTAASVVGRSGKNILAYNSEEEEEDERDSRDSRGYSSLFLEHALHLS